MKIINIFNKSLIKNLTFAAVFLIIGGLSYSYAFFFHFFMDDWGLLWYAATDLEHFFSIFTYHPGLFISFFPWVYWFSDNPIYYNLLGFVFKILAALSFGLVFKQLFGSVKYFWLSSIAYVSFFGGLEAFTFTGARVTALIIIASNLIVYFYFRAVRLNRNSNFISMLMVLYLAILADPLKIIFLPYLLLGWETLEQLMIQKVQIVNLIKRFFIISVVILIGFLSTGFGWSLFNQSSGFQAGIIQTVLEHPEYGVNFSNSLVFLIGTYIDGPSGFDRILGGLFVTPSNFMFFLLLLATFGTVWTFIKRKQDFSYWLLALLAVPILYIPNWVAFPYLNTYASHRYQALSAVFLLFLITFLIFRMKRKMFHIFISIMVLLNIFRSYQILLVEKNSRDYFIVERIYQYIDQNIPVTEKGGIIYYHGEGNLMANQVTWAGGGTIPIGLKRQTYNFADIPSATSDLDLAVKLICSSSQPTRLVIDQWIPREKKIDIESFHSFHIGVKGDIEEDTAKMLPKIREKCKEYN